MQISITTNEKEREITFFDSGVGMTRQEIIDNLGTIARSGSQEFLKKLDNTTETSSTAAESIIG